MMSHRHARKSKFEDSSRFYGKHISRGCAESIFACAILTNSVFIALEVQYSSSHIGKDLPRAFLVVGHAFAAFFLFELVYRLLTQGFQKLFCSSDWHWAVLDVVIVAGSLSEFMVDLLTWQGVLASSSSVQNATNIRIIRMIRITRVLRTFRIQYLLRFVSPLRMLVYSIYTTMKSLVWALVLLLMIMYVFSITLVQATTDFLEEAGIEGDLQERLRSNFGGVEVGMFTLFQCVTGGVSWIEAAQPLRERSVVLLWLFLIYIGFTYFAVMNVVTGVFCCTAIENTQKNPEIIANSLIAGRNQYANNLRWLFNQVDETGEGKITIRNFENLLNDEKMRAYLQALELDVCDAWTLFRLIDVDRSGLIEIDEFVQGCQSLKGNASGIDIANMMYEQKKLAKKMVDNFEKCLETNGEIVHEVVGIVHSVTQLESAVTSMGTRLRLATLAPDLKGSVARRDVVAVSAAPAGTKTRTPAGEGSGAASFVRRSCDL